MIFQHSKIKFINRIVFPSVMILCFAVEIFAQQSGRVLSTAKSAGAVKLKKAMVIGRKNPVLVNPSSRRTDRLISVGVLNSRAKNLVMPNFGETWRREIRVQVMIDEAGKVISAKSNEKNPSSRRAAERAARQSVFMPFVLRGQARRAVGIIIYNPTT